MGLVPTTSAAGWSAAARRPRTLPSKVAWLIGTSAPRTASHVVALDGGGQAGQVAGHRRPRGGRQLHAAEVADRAAHLAREVGGQAGIGGVVIGG